ncbi:CHAT domain-containing protein [Microseira wollei]|nr:CHAT domain-containing protein [Microseira wollei]
MRLKKLLLHVGLGLLTLVVANALSPSPSRSYDLPPNLPLIQTSTDARSLLQQGRAQADAGRFSEAARLWQQAASEYRQQGDKLQEAMSLSYLSFAYLQLGQLPQAIAAMQQSQTLLQQASNQPGATVILAQALNTFGSIQLAMGQTEAALQTWENAANNYDFARDEVGKLGAIINQSQALQTLGLYRRAQALLEQVNQQLQSQSDTLIKATGLRSLGVALQVVGNLERSQEVLQQSLAISQKLGSDAATSAALFSLGNTNRAQENFDAAIEFYRQAAAKATTPLDKTEALLSQLKTLVQQQQWEEAKALLPQIKQAIANLPPSRMSVYAVVNFAQSWIKIAQVSQSVGAGFTNQSPHPRDISLNPPQSASSYHQLAISNYQEIAQLLAKAIQQAKQLNDKRAEAYALGELGKVYQLTGQLAEAQSLTEQALLIANGISAEEIAAQMQAQLGEILKYRGDINGSIAAYTNAVKTLNTIRRDLVAMNPEVQFSFLDSVEPVYRELIDLLLQPPLDKGADQKNLKQALEVIEGLQIAELDNFFRQACLDGKPQQIDKIDPRAAVIYPMILKDRIEVILSLPGKRLRNYKTYLPQAEIERNLKKLRGFLSLSAATPEHLSLYGTLYDWLIRPAQTEIAESGVKTLVFVINGSLRNLPMAALYDGQQYLIEKYSIAFAPGLQLLEPHPLATRQIKTLIGGLSEARQGFIALPGVQSEVDLITRKVSSEVLLNQKFTSHSLKRTLSETKTPVLHLATHGQFSSKIEETFILTWDGKLNVAELSEVIGRRNETISDPIELLVLSACQTAKGDKRAVLGLAGLAVKSGARSTMATLWSVNDESTADFMAEFYKQLAKPDSAKSEALRQAQLFLLKQPKYNHPFYWAPFVLVGNWL